MKLYISKEKDQPHWLIHWHLFIPEFGDISQIEDEYKIRAWCIEVYGLSGIRWHDYLWVDEIRFFDKKDADWFLLKWG